MAEGSQAKARIGLAAFAAMTVSAPAVFSINPLMLTPMTEEFGWGRATISSAYLVAAPVMALAYTMVGPMLDRFGVRRIVIPGFLLFGCATALLSQLSGSVAQLLIFKIIATACGTLVTGVAFGKVVSRNFTNNRGVMLGFCLGAGGGLGMTIIPLIGAQILAASDWRTTYVSIGILASIVGLLASISLPKDAPARSMNGNIQDAPNQQAEILTGISAKTALRQPAFIILLVTTLLACMVLNGTLAHIAAIMTDSGQSPAEAALALSVYAGAMMCGQFGIGFLLDRISTPRLILPIFFVVLTGVLCLHFGQNKAILLLGVALIGAGAGSEYGILPYMLTRFFGLRSFGTLYGLIYATSAIGTGIGPFGMGLAFDLTHSYGRALWVFEGAIMLIIILLWRLPRYVFAADGTVIAGAGPRPEKTQ